MVFGERVEISLSENEKKHEKPVMTNETGMTTLQTDSGWTALFGNRVFEAYRPYRLR